MIAAQGYASALSASFVTMLASAAGFRTLTGATTEAAARGFIIEDIAGDNPTQQLAVSGALLDLNGPHAVVRVGPIQSERRAYAVVGRSGQVGVELWVPIPPDQDPASVFRSARNAQGVVMAEIEAQARGPATPGSILGEAGDVVLQDLTGARRSLLLAPITFTWSDL